MARVLRGFRGPNRQQALWALNLWMSFPLPSTRKVCGEKAQVRGQTGRPEVTAMRWRSKRRVRGHRGRRESVR